MVLKWLIIKVILLLIFLNSLFFGFLFTLTYIVSTGQFNSDGFDFFIYIGILFAFRIMVAITMVGNCSQTAIQFKKNWKKNSV